MGDETVRTLQAPCAAVGILLIAVALGAAAPVRACTPPPCIAATPNPVHLPSGQTQGVTTLDWASTATVGGASVQVLEGSQIIATYAVAAQGQQAITVEAGKSYTARLARQDRSGRQIVATVEITVTQGPKIVIPGPQQVATIKNLSVVPRGTWVELDFTAPLTSRAEVWISKNAPQGNSEQGLQVAAHAAPTGNPQFQHEKRLYDLAPASHYYYLIRTTSQNGMRAHASGSFTTLRRYATVSIDKIYVIDDSDDLSAGDLAFSFHLNGGAEAPGGASFVIGGTRSSALEVDSGETIPVGKTLEVETSEVTVRLNSTGFDEDGFEVMGLAFLGPSCRYDLPFVGSYSDDACDRAGANRDFSGLGPRPQGVETFKVADFQQSVLGDALRFRVHGRLWVHYK